MQIKVINNKINFSSNKKTKVDESQIESFKIKKQAPNWFEPVQSDVVEIGEKPEIRELNNVEKALLKAQKITIEAQARSVSNEASRLQNDGEEIGIRILDINFDTKEIIANAIKKYDKAMEILIAASKDNYATRYNQDYSDSWDRREFEIKNGVVTMFEYDFDDEVIREITFGNDLIKISEYNEEQKGWDVYEYDPNTSNLTKFTIGKKESANGAYSCSGQYVFEGESELKTYDVKFKQTSKGTVKSSEHYDFVDGYIKTYKNEYVKNCDNSETAFEQFEFNKGQLAKYYEQLKKESDGETKAVSMYRFNNQQGLLMCARGLKQDDEGAEANTMYICSNNEIKLAYLNYEFDSEEKEASADRIFRFDEFNKIQKCAFNCKGGATKIGKINNPQFESMIIF